jgi:hypothetical protein
MWPIPHASQLDGPNRSDSIAKHSNSITYLLFSIFGYAVSFIVHFIVLFFFFALIVVVHFIFFTFIFVLRTARLIASAQCSLELVFFGFFPSSLLFGRFRRRRLGSLSAG